MSYQDEEDGAAEGLAWIVIAVIFVIGFVIGIFTLAVVQRWLL